jgi:hypothetical protein
MGHHGAATSPPAYFVLTAGQTSKTITVSVKQDKTGEADETFFVDLTSIVNGLPKKGRGVGTILNDDYVAQSATLLAKTVTKRA